MHRHLAHARTHGGDEAADKVAVEEDEGSNALTHPRPDAGAIDCPDDESVDAADAASVAQPVDEPHGVAVGADNGAHEGHGTHVRAHGGAERESEPGTELGPVGGADGRPQRVAVGGAVGGAQREPKPESGGRYCSADADGVLRPAASGDRPLRAPRRGRPGPGRDRHQRGVPREN